MASEGAIVDWSALYLKNISLAKASWIGLGFTVFSATMAFGRFVGDGLSIQFGSKVLILVGLILSMIGFVCVLWVQPLIAVFGFGLVGLGLSVIIPELFRLGGKTPHIDASISISFISGVGFFGFLVAIVMVGLCTPKSVVTNPINTTPLKLPKRISFKPMVINPPPQ